MNKQVVNAKVVHQVVRKLLTFDRLLSR